MGTVWMLQGLNAASPPILFRQRMSLRQLVRIPCREPVPNRLFADLILRHRCNHLVVNQQAIHVKRLQARGIGGLEFHGLAPLRILNPREQRRLEQLRFVLELLQADWEPNGRATGE